MSDTPLTDADIEEGLRLDAARTPGGWEKFYYEKTYSDLGLGAVGVWEVVAPAYQPSSEQYSVTEDMTEETVDFICHAANHYRAALWEVKGLRVAYSLMQKGMESIAELQDGLKQEVRELREENARLREQNGPAVMGPPAPHARPLHAAWLHGIGGQQQEAQSWAADRLCWMASHIRSQWSSGHPRAFSAAFICCTPPPESKASSSWMNWSNLPQSIAVASRPAAWARVFTSAADSFFGMSSPQKVSEFVTATSSQESTSPQQ